VSYRYRLIDTAGGEIGIVEDVQQQVGEGETIALPDGSGGVVVEVYDDEHGTEGGGRCDLVIDDDTPLPSR
jgi:hypothetical protein